MTITRMKTRSGFVSNSSSCSFIIGEADDSLLNLAKKTLYDEIKQTIIPVTVNQVAEKLLEESGRPKTLKNFIRSSKGVEYDYVVFRSINQPTEIFYMSVLGEKYNKNIFISTCNNEIQYWYKALDKMSDEHGIKYKCLDEDGFYEKIEKEYYSISNRTFNISDIDDRIYSKLNYIELRSKGFNVCVFPEYESGLIDMEE